MDQSDSRGWKFYLYIALGVLAVALAGWGIYALCKSYLIKSDGKPLKPGEPGQPGTPSPGTRYAAAQHGQHDRHAAQAEHAPPPPQGEPVRSSPPKGREHKR